MPSIMVDKRVTEFHGGAESAEMQYAVSSHAWVGTHV